MYDRDPAEWAASIDPTEKVGARHHVVPKFILERWADSRGVVQVYSRVSDSFDMRSTKDLGITDFYTFISTDGQRDASLESILAVVEAEAAALIRDLLDPFSARRQLTRERAGHLGNFLAFQIARGPRRRREFELMADWYGKTMAAAEVAESELRDLFVPHQNEHLRLLGPTSEAMAQHIYPRPIALVTLDKPLLFTCDEPVVVNTGGDHVIHHPDCCLTDADIEARLAKERKKKMKRRRNVRRIVHFAPTQPRGVADAVELLMPIGPRSVLLWGPKGAWDGYVVQDRLVRDGAVDFAARVNEQMVSYALDVVITRADDDEFRDRAFPPPVPLLQVCDGSGVAKDAINTIPVPLRPRRLRRT